MLRDGKGEEGSDPIARTTALGPHQNGKQAVRPPRQKVNSGLEKTRESDTLIIETQRMAKKSEGVLKPQCKSDFEKKPAAEEVMVGDSEELKKEEEEKELRAAKAAAARAKLRAALGIGINAAGKKQEDSAAVEGEKTQTLSKGGVDEKKSESTGSGGEVLEDPGKAERIAATKAKMREALLSAAMAEVGRGGERRSLSTKEAGGGSALGKVESGDGLERRASTGRRASTTQAAPQGGGRRSSGAVEAQNTIWAFFEEGRKKGTCKTCGYVVGIKHNHGGLTRFLHLFFPIFFKHLV